MTKLKSNVFAILAGSTILLAAGTRLYAAEVAPFPDFTAGGRPDKSHDWLLGPTGLRGWMYFRHEDLTAASRQILVTAVDAGSPPDGMLRVNEMWAMASAPPVSTSFPVTTSGKACCSASPASNGAGGSRLSRAFRYGKNAREVLSGLKKLVRDLEKREEGQQPSDQRKSLMKAIADIEATSDAPEIVTLKQFSENASIVK